MGKETIYYRICVDNGTPLSEVHQKRMDFQKEKEQELVDAGIEQFYQISVQIATIDVPFNGKQVL